MPWKETDLLADLASRCKAVGQPIQLDSDSKGVEWKQVNIFEVAEKTSVPVARRKNVEYYVFNAGTAQEEAYYSNDFPSKLSDEILKAEAVAIAAEVK